MLFEMFGMNGVKFSRAYTYKVQVPSWDDRHLGWINTNRLHQLAQRVALFGPLAGILGRGLEHELQANPLLNLLSYPLMETSTKENNVFKDVDIESTRWDYWDDYDEPRRSEVQLTSNEQPSASSLVLIPSPMYSDRREREKDCGEQSRASRASRR